jgi:hypothetical protein
MMFCVLILVFGTALLGGLVAMFCVTSTAPLGYQDATGFHFGTPTQTGQSAVRAQVSVAGAAQSAFVVKLFDGFAVRGSKVNGAC